MNAPPPCRGRLRSLRPYQERAFVEARAALSSGKRRPTVQIPTGGGKTLLAASIVKSALDRGRKVTFVTPALSLVDQTVAAFEREGIFAVGVMQGYLERTNRLQPVQVASIQMLARRRKPDADLVIVDEAHIVHQTLVKWMGGPAMASVPFIGLSATPGTPGLGKHYDCLIKAATTSGLISGGYLSPLVAYAPSNPDLSNVSTVAGDFRQDEPGDAMDLPQITGDIVETWLKRGENQPSLCYCVNRKHARHVCERFNEAGVPAEYLDGNTPREDREATFARFRAGETRVICNVGVLTTGIDLPIASCIIDAQPTKSRILFVQTIGRGLRTAPGRSIAASLITPATISAWGW